MSSSRKRPRCVNAPSDDAAPSPSVVASPSGTGRPGSGSGIAAVPRVPEAAAPVVAGGCRADASVARFERMRKDELLSDAHAVYQQAYSGRASSEGAFDAAEAAADAGGAGSTSEHRARAAGRGKIGASVPRDARHCPVSVIAPLEGSARWHVLYRGASAEEGLRASARYHDAEAFCRMYLAQRNRCSQSLDSETALAAVGAAAEVWASAPDASPADAHQRGSSAGATRQERLLLSTVAGQDQTDEALPSCEAAELMSAGTVYLIDGNADRAALWIVRAAGISSGARDGAWKAVCQVALTWKGSGPLTAALLAALLALYSESTALIAIAEGSCVSLHSRGKDTLENETATRALQTADELLALACAAVCAVPSDPGPMLSLVAPLRAPPPRPLTSIARDGERTSARRAPDAPVSATPGAEHILQIRSPLEYLSEARRASSTATAMMSEGAHFGAQARELLEATRAVASWIKKSRPTMTAVVRSGEVELAAMQALSFKDFSGKRDDGDGRGSPAGSRGAGHAEAAPAAECERAEQPQSESAAPWYYEELRKVHAAERLAEQAEMEKRERLDEARMKQGERNWRRMQQKARGDSGVCTQGDGATTAPGDRKSRARGGNGKGSQYVPRLAGESVQAHASGVARVVNEAPEDVCTGHVAIITALGTALQAQSVLEDVVRHRVGDALHEARLTSRSRAASGERGGVARAPRWAAAFVTGDGSPTVLARVLEPMILTLLHAAADGYRARGTSLRPVCLALTGSASGSDTTRARTHDAAAPPPSAAVSSRSGAGAPVSHARRVGPTACVSEALAELEGAARDLNAALDQHLAFGPSGTLAAPVAATGPADALYGGQRHAVQTAAKLCAAASGCVRTAPLTVPQVGAGSGSAGAASDDDEDDEDGDGNNEADTDGPLAALRIMHLVCVAATRGIRTPQHVAAAWDSDTCRATWPLLIQAARGHPVTCAIACAAASMSANRLLHNDAVATCLVAHALARRAASGGHPRAWACCDARTLSLVEQLCEIAKHPDVRLGALGASGDAVVRAVQESYRERQRARDDYSSTGAAVRGKAGGRAHEDGRACGGGGGGSSPTAVLPRQQLPSARAKPPRELRQTLASSSLLFYQACVQRVRSVVSFVRQLPECGAPVELVAPLLLRAAHARARGRHVASDVASKIDGDANDLEQLFVFSRRYAIACAQAAAVWSSPHDRAVALQCCSLAEALRSYQRAALTQQTLVIEAGCLRNHDTLLSSEVDGAGSTPGAGTRESTLANLRHRLRRHRSYTPSTSQQAAQPRRRRDGVAPGAAAPNPARRSHVPAVRAEPELSGVQERRMVTPPRTSVVATSYADVRNAGDALIIPATKLFSYKTLEKARGCKLGAAPKSSEIRNAKRRKKRNKKQMPAVDYDVASRRQKGAGRTTTLPPMRDTRSSRAAAPAAPAPCPAPAAGPGLAEQDKAGAAPLPKADGNNEKDAHAQKSKMPRSRFRRIVAHAVRARQ